MTTVPGTTRRGQDANPREEEHTQDDRHAEAAPRGQNPTDGNDNGDPFASRSISPTVPFTPSEWMPHSNGTAVSPTGERLQAGRDTGNNGRTSTDGEGTDLSRINREGRDSNNDATCHAGTTQASPHDPHTPETCGDPSGDAANQAVDSAADDRDPQAASEPGDSAGDENTANRSSDGRASNIGRANDLAAHNPPIQGAGLAYACQDRGIDTTNREVTPVAIPTATPAGAAGTIDAPGATDTGHANRPPDGTTPGETHIATQAEGGAASGTTTRAPDWHIACDEPGETTGVGPTTCGSIGITPHPTRRPLTGEREESTARRVRTSSPTRSGETPAALACGWGLGTCNAEERWNICDQYISEHGTSATRQGVIQSLRNGGCTSQIAESTVQTWFQAGLLIHDGEFVRPGNTDSQASWLALQPLTGHEPCNRETTSVALLSLFDGTGLARIAMGEAIHDCGGITLVRSAFVEHDRTLANRVANVWNNEVSSGRTQDRTHSNRVGHLGPL